MSVDTSIMLGARAIITNDNVLELDALGTHWWIELLGRDWTPELQRLVEVEISAFERSYTRFSDQSLLGKLNLHNHLCNPPPEMIRMLKFARRMQRETLGIFNISVGGELVHRGYGHLGKGSVSRSFWNEVNITPEEITLPSGISLDFGGFGKGWLIDKLGSLLRSHKAPHFIINGGGDLLIDSREPIEIALEHPYEAGQTIGSTHISRGALAVSSTVKRSWDKNGERQHHIIDPRTSKPSDPEIVSTYVRAETALIADTCATVLLIAPDLDQSLTKMYHLKTILVRREQLDRS